MNELKQQIAALIYGPVAEEGYEIADIVLSRYKNNVTVRLYVYGEKGVSVDDCAQLSRMVGEIIDHSDLLKDGCTLEVSSPGLKRPLTTAMDFKYRAGETVRIEFADKSRVKITAEIISADVHRVEFKNDSGHFEINLADIDNAKIVF